ncbi:2OG-Fe(II) oxygenase [Microbulbifer marinus]|uniref:Proline 4-hydroxylase (Includes Rps23 Pro-64 3,4-dihydroxylase Tpa1), contains SM-20 domain n=1 Tax=Microbulbifer marinus TaxID=658218 RepID=A0A1H3VN58_9GAMM|nr:2OG-Fe(II) oxygenase [Microbulbifer marinus]SDZ76233.1 Proline 4-hydroxylase (includes Rps23 Pro-64 3,4-dihydroxylase Tpa1), contains SM-20 domain [Microbulbifer marinus]
MTSLVADASRWLDTSALTGEDALIKSLPFPFFVAPKVLTEELMSPLLEDFPRLKGAGYLPYEKEECGDSINTLIEGLVDPAFADAIGKNLGIEQLSQYPTYVSISRSLKKRHGNIHTDGKSKVATALLYLNPEWTLDGNGCLRFLNRIDDYEDMVVPEIKPAYGTLVAFKRAENSFHGHLPFEGQRLVIQIAWLVSAADKDRKAKRGKLSHKLKQLQGWLGRKFGGAGNGTAEQM